MKITAILCTYNRCQSLSKALSSLALSSLPESLDWEVLVVDNNSSDQTREVTEEICRRYPGRFRYLFEGRPGKSHALNAGIRNAQSDVLAFVDDDVTVDSKWLEKLCSPVFEGTWVGVGGRVLPQQDVVFPAWISDDASYVRGPLVMFDLGTQRIELKEAPFGTNMAFRREVFVKHGGFRTDLGPQPGSEIRGEDSEFVYRLLGAGEPLCYEPTAIVYHAVPQSRLSQKYFLDWWFDKGRSDVRAAAVPKETRWLLCGVPLLWVRRYSMWMLRWMISLQVARRFAAKTRVWYLGGMICEAFETYRRTAAGTAQQSEPIDNLRASTVRTTTQV